jgi:hypothetical protein
VLIATRTSFDEDWPSAGIRHRVPTVAFMADFHFSREYLDETPFWNAIDPSRKLTDLQTYYNHHPTHSSLGIVLQGI